MTDYFKSFGFIVLLAALSGLSAFGIDGVLPAFPEMKRFFGLDEARGNDIQLVVYVFMLGFAMMQLLFGVMADFFGRKRLLLAGIVIYVLASVLIIFTNDFQHFLWLRFLQGAGLAAPRVIAMAVVRDVVSGREMSRILSFVTMVFLLVPIFAPSIGQLAIHFGDWHTVFYLLVVAGIGMLVWVGVRLPETLPKAARKPPNVGNIVNALKMCFVHRPTLVYMLMLGMMFGMMMTYIGQSEQIYGSEVYQLGDKFALAFAVTALGMVAASFLNSQLVMRLGMRRIVFFALLLMLTVDSVLLVSALLTGGKPPLGLFMGLLIVHLFCFSMSMPNLNSLILEPHGAIAGTVSAVVGTLMSVFGVVLASQIARYFDGTVLPLAFGWVALSVLCNVSNVYVNRLSAR